MSPQKEIFQDLENSHTGDSKNVANHLMIQWYKTEAFGLNAKHYVSTNPAQVGQGTLILLDVFILRG